MEYEKAILQRLKKLGIEPPASPKKNFLGPLSETKHRKINNAIFRGLGRGRWLLVCGLLSNDKIKIFGRAHTVDVAPRILDVLGPKLRYDMQISSSTVINQEMAEHIRNEITKRFRGFVYNISITKDEFPHVDINIACKGLSKVDIINAVFQYLDIVSEETSIGVATDMYELKLFCHNAETSVIFPPSLFQAMLAAFNKSLSCNISGTGYCLWYAYITNILGGWRGQRKGLIVCEQKERNKKVKIKKYKF